ncbi:MAG: zf-HC2 domain-containing protein [Acidimicrobiales bacterium]
MTKPRRLRGTRQTASCMQVMRVLQSYLDGQIDEITARRVASHLEACRQCGLEASTYLEIKASLARKGSPADEQTLDRLRAFSAALVENPSDGQDPRQSLPPA